MAYRAQLYGGVWTYPLLHEDEIRSVEGRGLRLDDPDAASRIRKERSFTPLAARVS